MRLAKDLLAELPCTWQADTFEGDFFERMLMFPRSCYYDWESSSSTGSASDWNILNLLILHQFESGPPTLWFRGGRARICCSDYLRQHTVYPKPALRAPSRYRDRRFGATAHGSFGAGAPAKHACQPFRNGGNP
jgi:hypothetical protein